MFKKQKLFSIKKYKNQFDIEDNDAMVSGIKQPNQGETKWVHGPMKK